jgi:hypothetical protein
MVIPLGGTPISGKQSASGDKKRCRYKTWRRCNRQRVKDGQKVEYNIQQWPSESLAQKHKDMGCAKVGGPGGTFRIGSPLGTVAVLMARGLIKATGCFPPGLVEPTEEFIKQEVAMGQNVEITKTIQY